MKQLLTICAILIMSASGFAQSAAQADAKATAYLSRIQQLAEEKFSNTTVDDSLSAVNDDLLAYMKAALKSPATLTAPFTAAKVKGLDVATAPDGKVRFYNWDTETGGTMHFFTDLAQFKTSKGVAVRTMPDKAAEGDPGCFYKKIYSIQAHGETVYMVTYGVVGSNRDKGDGINAYHILNDKLVPVSIFHTATKALDGIWYSYDFFATDDGVNGSLPEIHFTDNNKKLYIPVVKKDGAHTKGWLVYVFDGSNYVFDKNAK